VRPRFSRSLRPNPGLRSDEVRSMKSISAYVVVFAGALAVACGPVAAQVKVSQGSITLPTYEEGKPDSNPPFDTYSTTQFSYPYSLRKNLTGQKQEHDWRAVFLENEYLKCTVLPDIGGHLYTCIDKVSGQPMFYANPSIKKAQIGYRGAWAAFGIEYNFPVSHNWVSMSPVDFSYATHPDGSASVSVGNIDRVYGMQWGVELVLRPGSTLLEERVTLYNRSDVRHRYYWWNNAGIQVWDDSHIEYPMQFAASHGFTEVRHWPVAPDGMDLSVIKNQQNGPVSFFVHGSHEPFMGIWNPKTQTGTVHYAEYSELPAKKIWSWGADADGLGWRKALSDNDSAYVEVQAGLFRNQETYAFLDPGQTIRFSEYWMPVRGTGGISRANKVGVVSLQSRHSNVFAALNVNERLPGAQIRLLQNGQTLSSETVDLTPEKMWSHSVSVKDPAAKVTFELRDHEGKMLLSHTDGKYDWDRESTIKVGPQQTYDIPDADSRTEDEWLKLGTDQELNGKIVLALETYEAAMAKHPDSLILQMAAGRLAASLQHYAEAESLLQSAQKRDTPNAEIAYYLGIAEDGLGHTREAQTAYEVAYRQAAFRARAAARIGELQARRRDWHAAQEFLKGAVEAAPLDLRTTEQLESITRAMGDAAQADQLARRGLGMDPMSDFLKEEMGKPDLPHLAADPYRVLRVATEYMNLGLYQRALIALERTYPEVPPDQSEPGSVLPQDHPLVLYYAAFCKAKLGKDAIQNWKTAERLSPSTVFPSSPMDRTVLDAALAANNSDGTAHYLLGTLLFSKGLHELGMEHWTEAKRLTPKLPVLDADMGKAWLHLNGDPQRALKSFREGAENDSTNADIYIGLDEAMSVTGVSAKERAETLERYPSSAGKESLSAMPANLVYQLALTRAEAGQYEEALVLFKDRFFPSEEGGVSSAQVLFEIRLMQAEAEAASGSCAEAGDFLAASHPGLEVNGAVSEAHLRMAAIAKECQHPQLSEQLLQKAAASGGGVDSAWVAKAQKLLGTYDAMEQRQILQASLAAAERVKDTSAFTGWWYYNIGTIQAALNHRDQAKEAFNKALLLPDSMMSHHMSRAAIADLSTDKSSY
jgi:tetratricopeptide (TPR) repeat protein